MCGATPQPPQPNWVACGRSLSVVASLHPHLNLETLGAAPGSPRAPMAVSTSGPSPAGAAPAVSPNAAPPLASSVAETADPNSPPSSGRPDGQAATSLTPPSAFSAGAESASARSPTQATGEPSAGLDDSAVGSTQPPLSSACSTSSSPTSVGLGLLTGAADALSSASEVSWRCNGCR
ncbi:unnamed protein product [Phytophthora fragariaefolia]|uniref:Unnamed protein product n=1 Tax=Phytophthora fragariaefolia TaxID=1490495 RepID=A0A9W6X981_9STRA|nr:unnamed protein product [Phytophthora fragariaefolia]